MVLAQVGEIASRLKQGWDKLRKCTLKNTFNSRNSGISQNGEGRPHGSSGNRGRVMRNSRDASFGLESPEPRSISTRLVCHVIDKIPAPQTFPP